MFVLIGASEQLFIYKPARTSDIIGINLNTENLYFIIHAKLEIAICVIIPVSPAEVHVKYKLSIDRYRNYSYLNICRNTYHRINKQIELTSYIAAFIKFIENTEVLCVKGNKIRVFCFSVAAFGEICAVIVVHIVYGSDLSVKIELECDSNTYGECDLAACANICIYFYIEKKILKVIFIVRSFGESESESYGRCYAKTQISRCFEFRLWLR